jgi:hypothetical protein
MIVPNDMTYIQALTPPKIDKRQSMQVLFCVDPSGALVSSRPQFSRVKDTAAKLSGPGQVYSELLSGFGTL